MSDPSNVLYEYTRALASGISISDSYLKTLLPNLYIENKKPPLDLSSAPLVYTGDYSSRFSHSYGDALTRIGQSFGVVRIQGETDDSFRQKIKLVIIKSPTVQGVKNSFETVFSGLGLNVIVNVKPANKNFLDSVATNLDDAFRGSLGARLFKVSIEIYPPVKTRYPNFVGRVFANIPYRVKKPGFYELTFDRETIFGSNVRASLLIRTPQTNISQKVLEEFFLIPGRIFNLGFLSNFQEILISTQNDLSGKYYADIVFNDERFDFYNNPSYNTILSAFAVDFLREIFSEVFSYGVEIERIVVRQVGTGG
jgi:hypothetical protein